MLVLERSQGGSVHTDRAVVEEIDNATTLLINRGFYSAGTSTIMQMPTESEDIVGVSWNSKWKGTEEFELEGNLELKRNYNINNITLGNLNERHRTITIIPRPDNGHKTITQTKSNGKCLERPVSSTSSLKSSPPNIHNCP